MIGVVSRLKEAIQENDIVSPMTGAVAGKIGRLIAHTVEFTSEKIQEFKQAKAEGGSEKGYKLKFDQERERSQRETAQKSGLNQKLETGKESGQGIPGQEKSTGNNNEQNKGKGSEGDTFSQRGTQGNVLIANDPNNVGEGGIRTDVWGMGIPEGQNVRYISGTTLAEFEGKTYAISYKGVEVLSADGSTILKQAGQVQGVEIKNGILISSAGDVEGAGAAHRFTATMEKDLAKNTQKQVLTEWTK